MTLDEKVSKDSYQPKEVREHLDIYILPSLKRRIDACRGSLRRSELIELALIDYLARNTTKTA